MNFRQIIIGGCVITIGTLFYLVARPPEDTYFVFQYAFKFSLYQKIPNVFGSIGRSLPAFSHVFAFILITAGTMFGQKTIKGYVCICIMWCGIDLLFEFGQKYKDIAIHMVPSWFNGIPFLENTANYFKYGTFDRFDVLATIIGAILAYGVLIITGYDNQADQQLKTGKEKTG